MNAEIESKRVKKQRSVFLQRGIWVKIPSRCAIVIARKHKSGTHSLSTGII